MRRHEKDVTLGEERARRHTLYCHIQSTQLTHCPHFLLYFECPCISRKNSSFWLHHVFDLLSFNTVKPLCLLWKVDYTARIVNIVRPIYRDIYSTVKAKCATLSLRAFAFRFQKYMYCYHILPYATLSVAMHDGETDQMLGVMVVSQWGISLVRPMPLRCPFGDITSVLDGSRRARWFGQCISNTASIYPYQIHPGLKK